MTDLNNLPGDDPLPADGLAEAIAAALGLSQSGMVRRGGSIIATEESRSNVAFGTLPTPDRVTGVVVPPGGLLAVAYQALWRSSVNSAGRAAIHLGSNGAVMGSGAGNLANEAFTPANTNYQALFTAGFLRSSEGTGPVVSHATTGQIIGSFESPALGGGPVYIFAAAGTYDVSVQFRATSGSVTAKERKLWVWSIGF